MPDPAPASPSSAQAPPAAALPEGGGADQGLRIEQGFVGSSLNTSRAQRIQQALNAAVAEVGEVSPEQRAAEMAGTQPKHEKTAEATEEEPAEPKEAAPEKAKGEKKPKAEAKTEPEAPPEAVPGVHELVHERRKLRTNFENKHRQLEADYQGRLAQLQQHAQRLQPLHEAGESLLAGDFDGFAAAVGKAKGLTEVTDWNSLVNEATKVAGNPMYREVRTLKEQQRAAQEQLQRQQQAALQQQQQQARAQQEQQWVASIADDLTSDEDPAVSEIVDIDPAFAQHVYGTQKAHHSEAGEILPAREAAEKVLAPLWKNVKAWNDFFTKHAASPFIQKITGVRPAPKKAEKGTASPNGESGTTDRNGVRQRAAKPPPAVSQNRTAEATAQAPMSRDALKRMWAEKMNATTNRANSGEALPD